MTNHLDNDPDREFDSEGAPCDILNHYRCDCGANWQVAWSCEVNTNCPECGTPDIMPFWSPAKEDA